MAEYWDEFLGEKTAAVDPAVARLIALEEERQARRIILIPSESLVPAPVRTVLGSVFNNVYAEGYPSHHMLRGDEASLNDLAWQLADYRRYSDRRFYKGADYVDLVESLAQRRCAECFANARVSAADLHVNVQPLSGAAANQAVYTALLRSGDTLMGMDLFQGGHLTHGSRVNFSGQRYKVVSYGVADNGKLDYDQIMRQALDARPKIIVAGFTSYPWAPDWERLRAIADACGAYLMADVAHPAGLIVAGAYPSPVGLADVVTFTTHKTLAGPRGACIITHRDDVARKIDTAVFPGLQGGPHPQKFAAMAVAFHIAQSDAFKRLMFRITGNARALGDAIDRRGLTLAYGGTDTHLLLIDLRTLKTPTGEPLLGEPAVRIMELAGLVANKNTIPGDTVTALASGIRLGTPWVTQRGMGPVEMDAIADAIARLLTTIHPFHYVCARSVHPRGKLPFEVLEAVKRDVADLAARSVAETHSRGSGYPHYFFASDEGSGALLVRGRRALPFLQQAGTADLSDLVPGDTARTLFLDGDGRVLADASVRRLEPDTQGRDRFLLAADGTGNARIAAWLRDLSDGYLLFDQSDVYRKVDGPVVVEEAPVGDLEPPTASLPFGTAAMDAFSAVPALFALHKPYFVGQTQLAIVRVATDRPEFQWSEPEETSARHTVLYETHRALTRRFAPFAGWEMPIWYSSIAEEHRAVREAAGLFDVSHMGVFDVSGPHAAAFLDAVSANYVRRLEPGQSHYSYLLDTAGSVLDDIMVYCLAHERYLLVVNAATVSRDWAWLSAVNERRVAIDRDSPLAVTEGPVLLRDLRDARWGPERRVDLALQGPASLAVLQALADGDDARALGRLRRTELTTARVAGLDVIVARTGYTGEEYGYELFVHPDEAVAFWNAILAAGEPLGVRPCGLAARDSLRTEAGLPLYGHELAGPLDIIPQEAGFEPFVKVHKPFFIGRDAVMQRAAASNRVIVRFEVNEPGTRPLRGGEHGETVVSRQGAYAGRVTSCTTVGVVQIGLALVDRRHAEPGNTLLIYPSPGTRASSAKSPATFGPGDWSVVPVRATLLPRFHLRAAPTPPETCE